MTAQKLWLLAMRAGAACGCHQRYERSFRFRGYQFPLCARCTGIALGQLLALARPAAKSLPKSLMGCLLLLTPTAVDGLTQAAGLQASTNRRRLWTGILAGLGYVQALRILLQRIFSKKGKTS